MEIEWIFEWDHILNLLETIIFFCYCDLFFVRRWRIRYCMLPTCIIIFIVQWGIYAFGLGVSGILLSIFIDYIALFINFQKLRGVSGTQFSWYQRLICSRIFFLAGFYVFYLLSQAGAMLLFNMFTDYSLDNIYSQDLHAVGAYVSGLLLLILILFHIGRFRKVPGYLLLQKHWLNLQFIPVTSIGVVLLIFPLGTEITISHGNALIIIYLFICFINIFVFNLYKGAAATVETEIELSVLRDLASIQDKYMANLVQARMENADLLHDYKKQIRFLSACVSNGEYDLLDNYLKNLEGYLEVVRIGHYSGNRYVDAVLSGELEHLQQYKISYLWKGGVLPLELPFESIDIVKLLGNALSNAGEACIRRGLSGACIEVRIYYEQNTLSLFVRNPITPAPHLNSRDKRHQGRGIGIMKQVADKYGGILNCGEVSGYYVTTAVLPAPIVKQKI